MPSNAACEEAASWPSAQAAEELEILRLVNQYRAAGATCGGVAKPAVGPLAMAPFLRCAARLHSQDMADRDYFSHATWNASAALCQNDQACPGGTICRHDGDDGTPQRCGKSPSARVAEVGGPAGAGWENIAAGNSTAAATMVQWMNSSGHCNNIMEGSLKTIGVGYARGGPYGHYWTQSFDN